MSRFLGFVLFLLLPAPAFASGVIVRHLPPAQMVEVSGHHTCVVLRQEATHCWGAEIGTEQWAGGGSNLKFWGQDDVKLRSIDHLSTSPSGNCAVHFGQVICWGSTTGQLDSGVLAPADRNSGFVDVVVGGQRECGIWNEPWSDLAKVRCWDSADGTNIDVPDLLSTNSDGVTQLVTSQDSSLPSLDEWCAIHGSTSTNLLCWDGGATTSKWPVHHVPGDLGQVKTVAMSHWTICAVKQNGQLRCWGRVNHAPSNILDPLQLRTGKTNCAITKNHQLQCWGEPLGVSHRLLRSFGKIDWISDLNSDHRCLVRNNGQVYCWGSDRYGQVSGIPANIVPKEDLRLYTYPAINEQTNQKEIWLGMYYGEEREVWGASGRLSGLSMWTNYPSKVVNYWQASRTGLGKWETQKSLPSTFDTEVGDTNIPAALNHRYLRACSRAWNSLGASKPVCTRPLFWARPARST